MPERALRTAVAAVVQLDASIMTGGGGTYLRIGAVAMMLPARRALRVDPATTLRSE
jgi:ABC-type antimicrobial peptide transport system permease subunit